MDLPNSPVDAYVAKCFNRINAAKRSFQYLLPVQGDATCKDGVAHIGSADVHAGGGTALKVTRIRPKSSEGGGYTRYRVEAAEASDNNFTPGKYICTYTVPLISGGVDTRDMISFVDHTDTLLDADEVTDEEEELMLQEQEGEYSYAGDEEEEDDEPAWDCGDWKKYMFERLALSQGITLWLREYLHSLLSDGYGEWSVIDTGSEVWHVLGLLRHRAGEGGSSCPICSAG